MCARKEKYLESNLQTITLFREHSHTIVDHRKNIFSNRIVAARIIIGCIFFATDHLRRMKKIFIFPIPNFINHTWLKINKN